MRSQNGTPHALARMWSSNRITTAPSIGPFGGPFGSSRDNGARRSEVAAFLGTILHALAAAGHGVDLGELSVDERQSLVDGLAKLLEVLLIKKDLELLALRL